MKNCYNCGSISTSLSNNQYLTPIYGYYGSNVENCYYSNTGFNDLNNTKYKPAASFENGEIAWLLNGGSVNGAWNQTIGTDDYPNFSDKTVYYNETDGYYNISGETEFTLDAEKVKLVNWQGMKNIFHDNLGM